MSVFISEMHDSIKQMCTFRAYKNALLRKISLFMDFMTVKDFVCWMYILSYSF